MSALIQNCAKAAATLWPKPSTLTITAPWSVKVYFVWSQGANVVTPSIAPNDTTTTCTATASSFSTQAALPYVDTPVNTLSGSAQTINANLPIDQRVTDMQARALDSLLAALLAQLPSGTFVGVGGVQGVNA